MILIYIAYFAIALAVLAGLSTMILKIGAMMGTCPISNGAARSASITIATGYSAIGLGGVLLAAILIPVLIEMGAVSLLSAIGVACFALGLGFSHAMATLRAVVAEVQNPTRPEPAPRIVEKPQADGPWDNAAPAS